MKMSTVHYNALQANVIPLLHHIPHLREAYALNPKIKDIEKATLWTIYHAAKMYKLYTYQEWDYLDSHIETAMKQILKVNS